VCGDAGLCSVDRNGAAQPRGKRRCREKAWLGRGRKRELKPGFGLGSMTKRTLVEGRKGPGCETEACGSWMNQLAWVEGKGPWLLGRSLLGWGELGVQRGPPPDGAGAEEGQEGPCCGERGAGWGGTACCHFRGPGTSNRWSFHIPIEEF